MQTEGVIKQYALGGATALLFYAEPALTFDIDVFIFFPESKKRSQLIDLSSLYHVLKQRGYEIEKEHVLIEGIPVQFIPAYNSLVEEAVRNAVDQDYQGTRTRVIQLEYLLAIMLETNRGKDRERIGKLLEEISIDRNKLVAILRQHKLDKKWEKTFGKIK